MKIIKLLLLSLVLFFSGCSSVSDETLIKAHNAVNNGALIVDVRTTGEFAGGHVKGAVNIPIQVLSTQLHTLDKQREIVVYCRSGSRSGSAAQYLIEKGYTVYDIATQGNWYKEVEVKK